MLDKMTRQLDFHGNALLLRAERQRVIASNIANADTPGYAARDFKFAEALREATGTGAAATAMDAGATGSGNLSLSGAEAGIGASTGVTRQKLGYAVQTQPSLDNNSVDLDRERASFVDNAVRYEATLRFINSQAKTMLSAIQGQ